MTRQVTGDTKICCYSWTQTTKMGTHGDQLTNKNNNNNRNYRKGEMVEDVGVIVGLVAVQFLYAANSILLGYFLNLGFRPSSLIIFSSFATFIILSPLALAFERKLWPRRFSYKLMIQVLLLSFGGVTVFQSLFMKGIKLTSPTMATAMPNLAPGLIFFIAWALRLERIEWGCMYSRAKVAGTLLCMLGAILMSVMQSAASVQSAREGIVKLLQSSSTDGLLDKDTMTGCVYLIAAVVVLSSQAVLQAITLREFPASISLCSVTSLVGMATTAAAHMVEEHSWELGWPPMTVSEMVAYAFVAGSVSGVCVTFNAWAMKRRGPVVVSMFNPLGTVISAAFSAVTLDESVGVGSLTGMCLMFSGLYFVLWGKTKEGFLLEAADYQDIEKQQQPLLS